MAEEEQIIKSKYSSGINIIIRIDQLWKDTHLHSRNGLFMMWNSDLDRIWLELCRDYDEEDEKFKIKQAKFDSFDTDLEKLMPFDDKGGKGFKKPTNEDIKKRNKIYKILMEKQKFLARLENELGKGTTPAEQEDDWD